MFGWLKGKPKGFRVPQFETGPYVCVSSDCERRKRGLGPLIDVFEQVRNDMKPHKGSQISPMGTSERVPSEPILGGVGDFACSRLVFG